MIIYNTTYFVESEIANEWLDWFQDEHIAKHLEHQHFQGARLTKLLTNQQEGVDSYSMQLFCENQAKLMQFKKDILPYLQTESLKKFGTKVLSFETEMEHLRDFEAN
ncbi:DUF4286 family protein [Vaginella massiliensis]|nr:DUF4286 family protein [Vaginella massiliensis]